MHKKDATLPGIRVSSDLANVFNQLKFQSNESYAQIGRELVQDFIRIARSGEIIVRPARLMTVSSSTSQTPAESLDGHCRLIRKNDDGSWILRCGTATVELQNA
jgi:hypothetical protein